MRAILPLVLLLPVPAFAHPHYDHGAGGGLGAGLLHPVSGLDHILAMGALGLLAAHLGGRARLALPAAFVGAMVAGGALGMAGMALPLVEPVILASAIVTGALVAAALRLPLAAMVGVAALFGLAHGNAHGLEGPAGGGLAYGAGFVLTTAALIAAGFALGSATARDRRRVLGRAVGGLACLAGLALLVV